MVKRQASAATKASERGSTKKFPSQRGRPRGGAWLRKSREHSRQIARAVRWIFAEYVDKGQGYYEISQRIRGRYRPFGNAKRWHPEAIRRILTDEAVVDNGLISQQLYDRGEQIRKTRKVRKNARKGKSATNLLKDLAVCIYCGSRMIWYKKGLLEEPMLGCSAWRRGRHCNVANEWSYAHIEKLVLRCIEVGLLKPMSQSKELEEAVQELESERDKTQQQMDDFLKLTAINRQLTYVAEKLAPLQRQLDELDRDLGKKRQELADMQRAALAFKRNVDELTEAIAKLQTEDHRRLFEARSEVHARLKSVIKVIGVAAAGLGSIEEEERLDGKPMLIIETKGGSQLQLQANMDNPYDVSNWSSLDERDAEEVFPDF